MICLKILYEDCQILVIDKPSGMVVNRAKTVKEETVQDWIDKKFQISNFKFQINSKSQIQNLKEFIRRTGIVHRLDKEASGVMMIAKTPEAFEHLKDQFKTRQVKKTYLALVHGKMEASEGEIRLPIKRLPWNRERFGIVPNGRKARTKYKLVNCYIVNATSYSLLKLEPETGRTHQIRVHLKSLGHPIVSDRFYGGRQAKKDRNWCPRLFLHASSLSLSHPRSGKKSEFVTPLPNDLEKILSGLKRA